MSSCSITVNRIPVHNDSLHITLRLAESPHLQCGKTTPFCQYDGASSSSIRTSHLSRFEGGDEPRMQRF
ncbi:unnamed protein product [Pleuronectes platessa]|uniref:Uncharacterized protein n=1 Tax=Pleuronectes platessa TaxID=8262 RepID=A0A9N7UN02_PLEPL|nr:unnamed protein product [Pleuronectes platessa]